MNNNEKLIVYFDTVPINPAVDPRGGYALKIKEQQIVSGNSVFEEVVQTKTLPISPELLEFAFECILSTMAERVSRDCRPRRVGKYLKAAPYMRGRVESPLAPYNPATCSCAILFTSLSAVAKTANTEKYVRFVNSRTGLTVTINHITFEGSTTEVEVIRRNTGILVTGMNCQWVEGDSCTLVWTDAEGTEHTAPIEPTASSVTEMHFAWPTALNDVPDGTDIEFRFLTRGGVAEDVPQPNKKTVTLIAEELLPTITKVATPEKDGVQKGQGFQADGANLGFNFATDHVSVKWTDPDGTPRQAAIVPSIATAETIKFTSCPVFDEIADNTTLTFEFELGGKVAAKNAVLLAAE